MSRTAVVVGASAGVGRALAERLAEQGHDLVLAASDVRDLDALARDLKLRFGIKAFSCVLDLTDPALQHEEAVRVWIEQLGSIDVILLPAGLVDSQDDRLPSTALLSRTINVNYSNIALLAAAAARGFEVQKSGTIVGFSSIAAAVPRRRNMVYAAAKSALETHFRALRHYFAGTGIFIQVYVLGYIDTAMSYGQKLRFKPISAQSAAHIVVADLQRDIGRVFLPGYWRWITAVLQAMPWRVYKQLRF